jgi:hypothetical protein
LAEATEAIMPEYRMRVYQAREKLWQTHVIHAQDDAAATTEAKRKYAELAKEQNAPSLDRFILYDDDRFICEEVTTR